MGWWRIDPETGMPLANSASALSKPPDFVLLNAVPGVDDDTEASYLGDGPWDMASTLPDELAAVVGSGFVWSADQVREVFLQNRIPLGIGGPKASALRQVVDAFWADIDTCYEDDWERGAIPSEKRWICETIVEQLTGRSPV